MTRLLAGVLAAVLCGGLAACTDSEPAVRPTPQPSPSASTVTLSAAEQRTVDVYVTLLRAHLAAEDDREHRRPVYLDTTPRGASAPLSVAVQQQITAAADSEVDVRWVRSLKSVTKPNSMIRGGGYYVGLPSVPADGDRFRLRVFALCGGLCGYGDRYLMTERSSGWHARAVGPMVIA